MATDDFKRPMGLQIVDETTPAECEVDRSAAIVHVSPEEVANSFADYQLIQAKLDKALPGSMISIKGRPFRKKTYWRAIATVFNLTLERLDEALIHLGDDWGYTTTYRATAPNGRFADGDGACMHSDKVGSGMESLHDVRAQASTRAKNRAISDLVGFGEVSYDELGDDARGGSAGAGSNRGSVRGNRTPASQPSPDPDAWLTSDLVSFTINSAEKRGDETGAHAFHIINSVLKAGGRETCKGQPTGDKMRALVLAQVSPKHYASFLERIERWEDSPKPEPTREQEMPLTEQEEFAPPLEEG